MDYDHLVKGLYFLATSSVLSNFAVTGAILWILAQNKLDFGIKALVLNLMISDWLLSLGMMVSLNWIAEGDISIGSWCSIQGLLINIGSMGTALWAVSICIYTYKELFGSFAPRWYLNVSIWIIWPIAIGFPITGFILDTPQKRFFNPSNTLWCCINPEYTYWRAFLHFGLILASLIFMFIMYGLMFFLARRRQIIFANTRRQALSKTGLKLIFYPVVYSFLVFPIAIARYVRALEDKIPYTWVVFASCLFTLGGLIDSIVYTWTTQAASMRPMFEHKPARKCSKRAEAFDSASTSNRTDEHFVVELHHSDPDPRIALINRESIVNLLNDPPGYEAAVISNRSSIGQISLDLPLLYSCALKPREDY
ncbi:hypothetical protein G9A89_023269 [Geosiphon pyriformis]|nr:hypothetical protein G9A89_023269 [Geosiphon pyriformis]